MQISLTFIPTSPIDNKPALVLVMTGQAVNWANDDPVNRRIYAALGGGGVKAIEYEKVTIPIALLLPYLLHNMSRLFHCHQMFLFQISV